MGIDEADSMTPSDPVAHPAPPAHPTQVGPVDSIRQLLRDARAAAEAETALVKAYVGAAGQIARRVGLWAGVALITFSVATMAGAVGIIITLASIIGPGMATFAVTGLLVAIGLVALWRARSHLRLLRRISSETLDDVGSDGL